MRPAQEGGVSVATRPRVVLAEDHASMAQQLRDLLADEFEVCCLVQDGEALVSAVEARHPAVVVTDIAMPRVDGFQAAERILSAHPDTRIVFVSVRDERAVVRHAFDCGGLGYVVKCDAGDELAAAVHAVLGGSRYVSAHARRATDGDLS
jgi:DNA-binding NarL/FixJ family response regulator